ncbi:hypothetical protein AUR61_010685 [Stutzerimonas balearica]|uniref:hypothetical protein n=1 Tax=Stutzerimonas balearica TaxID=74829 RepID=UPI0007731225|nr:hypothetical protein [Stutzerimonas balearica]OMG64324.1 hypothetical protein AUR61_010685 [Stutzerimonas balearica]
MAEVDPRARELGYEPQDASVPRVLLAGLIIAVGLGLSLGGVALLLHLYAQHEPEQPPTPREASAFRPAIPNLDAAAQVAAPAVLAAARRRLQTLGWVDRQAGLAHLPIDEAMARLAHEGWPEADASGEEPGHD